MSFKKIITKVRLILKWIKRQNKFELRAFIHPFRFGPDGSVVSLDDIFNDCKPEPRPFPLVTAFTKLGKTVKNFFQITCNNTTSFVFYSRSEEHTSELQSRQ